MPFISIDAPGETTPVKFDGQTYDLSDGANLAASLLAAGVRTLRRTPVSGAPRGAFCMMGACYDCLVEINGVTRQACMTCVRPGLVVVKPGQEGQKNER